MERGSFGTERDINSRSLHAIHGMDNFQRKGAQCTVYELSVVSCAQTAEPMEMVFKMLSQVDRRNHVLDAEAAPLPQSEQICLPHLLF